MSRARTGPSRAAGAAPVVSGRGAGAPPATSGHERGASALELAFIAPFFLALIFLTIQGGLFFYGRTVAVQAAREGVSQLRLAQDQAAYEAMREQAASYTRDFAASVGQQGLTNPAVSTRYDDEEGRVWVEVTGSVISLVPGVDLTTTAEASGIVERFRDPEQP